MAEPVKLGSRRMLLIRGGCGMRDSFVWDQDVWLTTWHGNQPQILSQSHALFDWFDSSQRPVSHGLHDFTMGYRHLRAFTTDYAWYRFDGKVYRKISDATAYESEGLLAQDRQQCEQKHQPCNLIPYSPNDPAFIL